MSEPATAKAPRASASSTSAATATKMPPPPADPLIGAHIGVGAVAVSIGGVEYDVDPNTGDITGLRA
jgi:hypothetical protein